MKKLNSLLFSACMLLATALPFQNAFAVQVPLKKGDTGAGGIPSVTQLRVSSFRTVAITPVFADLSYTELTLNFNVPIGNALVTVEDEMGGIVYVYSIDTNSSSELIIPVDGWESGNYTLTISYGSKTLNGSFEL